MRALIGRHNNKIPIRLIVNHACLAPGRKSLERITTLSKAKIPVWASRTQGTGRHGLQYEEMHHKFFILENNQGVPLVITGSYNPTETGNKSWNNVVILNNPAVIEQFKKEFVLLTQLSNP